MNAQSNIFEGATQDSEKTYKYNSVVQRRWYEKKLRDDPEYFARKRAKNLERFRKTQRESKARWRARNPEFAKLAAVKSLDLQRKNGDRYKVVSKQWRLENRERVRGLMRDWRVANPGKISANGAKRRAMKLAQVHPLADPKAISAIYRKKALLNANGAKWHVDHIIPLTSGGWHHEDNLQLLPEEINISKHANAFWWSDEHKTWRNVPRWLWPASLVPFYLVAEALIKEPIAA